jgi:hypothetical protein
MFDEEGLVFYICGARDDAVRCNGGGLFHLLGNASLRKKNMV